MQGYPPSERPGYGGISGLFVYSKSVLVQSGCNLSIYVSADDEIKVSINSAASGSRPGLEGPRRPKRSNPARLRPCCRASTPEQSSRTCWRTSISRRPERGPHPTTPEGIVRGGFLGGFPPKAGLGKTSRPF